MLALERQDERHFGKLERMSDWSLCVRKRALVRIVKSVSDRSGCDCASDRT
jgi:hypothetical protein